MAVAETAWAEADWALAAVETARVVAGLAWAAVVRATAAEDLEAVETSQERCVHVFLSSLLAPNRGHSLPN